MNKEHKEYIYRWYPHFGGAKIAKELDIPANNVTSFANRNGLKLLPQTERICYYCKKNKCRAKRGNRCHECMRPKWNEYTKKCVDKNPLDQRLKNCLSAAKKRSIKKKLDFDIDIEFLYNLWERQNGRCFYSDIPLKAHNYGEGHRHIDSISIDRIDCSKGYTKDNVVLCSYYANVAKSELSTDQLISMCERIIETAKQRKHAGR